MNVDVGLVAIAVTSLLALLAFSFGYGVLTQKVKGNRMDINAHKETYTAIYKKIDDVSARLVGVEAAVKANGKARRK